MQTTHGLLKPNIHATADRLILLQSAELSTLYKASTQPRRRRQLIDAVVIAKVGANRDVIAMMAADYYNQLNYRLCTERALNHAAEGSLLIQQ